jgi:hypothetical protein
METFLSQICIFRLQKPFFSPMKLARAKELAKIRLFFWQQFAVCQAV